MLVVCDALAPVLVLLAHLAYFLGVAAIRTTQTHAHGLWGRPLGTRRRGAVDDKRMGGLKCWRTNGLQR
eukprot:11211975-Lingulodinium_polyedra.AAC.1